MFTNQRDSLCSRLYMFSTYCSQPLGLDLSYWEAAGTDGVFWVQWEDGMTRFYHFILHLWASETGFKNKNM